MGEKNVDTDISNASNDGSGLPGKPEECVNNKVERSPTKKETDGLGETIEGKTCSQIENSEDKDDKLKNLLVEENKQIEVVAPGVAELEAAIKDSVEHCDEPKESETKEVVEQEGEKPEAVKPDNESKEVVSQEIARQDDENKLTLGKANRIKELGPSDNLVRAAAEDEAPKEGMSGEVSEDTKAIGEDGGMKVTRDEIKEEMGDNNELKEVKESKGDTDKERMETEVDQDYKTSTPVEVKRILERNGEDVKNGIETDEVEGDLNGSSNDEQKEEDDKGSKKRKRNEKALNKPKGGKEDGGKEDLKGQKTPVSSVSTRPVRERKSVERLVASVEKDVIREIFVEKGPGFALKDIPNVAFKLSKKKNDETFKQLHTILFGRRGKAIQMKNHVSQFSGFVWHDDEEKNKMKVREKFDKLVKEKLIEFCDVLDIPIVNKVSTKKDDVVTRIMDFLASPHPTTDGLLSEREHSEKMTKRKRSVGPGSPTPGSAKSSRKRRRKTSEKPKDSAKGESGSERESEKEDNEVLTEDQGNGKKDQSEDELSEKKSSESEDTMDEDTTHRRKRLKKTSVKVDSPVKRRTKSKTIKKPLLNDSKETKKTDPKNHQKSLSISSEKTGSAGKVRTSSEKKKEVKGVAEKELSIKTKNAGPKGKSKEEKLKPSDKVLRNQICQILKEVDFETATFTDILKLLGKHFKTDLTPRKASIKLIIQEELTKLADAANDSEDEEEDVTPEPAKIKA